jgi:tetratricopeptide (TPR) repeat protein
MPTQSRGHGTRAPTQFVRMRTLNIRLTLALGLTLALTTIVLFVVHHLQAKSIRDALLWQADQAERDGRPEQVVRHLRRYLEFAPHDVEARGRLGMTLAHPKLLNKPSDRQRARFVIEQVLARDPNQHALRKCLVKMALDAQYIDWAEEHLAVLRKTLPHDGATAGLFARWLELAGRETEALDFYRLALAQAPDGMDVCVRLIQLLRRLDRGRSGEFAQEARQVLSAVLVRGAQDKGVLLAAAELAQDHGELAQARSHLERIRQLHPREVQLFQVLARLEVRAQDQAAAINCLEQGLRVVPAADRFELYWTLANLHVDTGQIDSAKEVMRSIRQCGPPRGTSDYLHARILMLQSRWFEAARLLEHVRPAFKSSSALTGQLDAQLGQCYQHLELPARQKAAFGRALENDPASVVARQGLALALWSLGQTDAAIEQYRELSRQTQEPGRARAARAHLIRLLVYRNAQRDRPDWQLVEKELGTAHEDDPRSALLAVAAAEMHLARKQFEQAQRVLTVALEKRPDSLELWTALADVAGRQGQPDQARRLLVQARDRVGDTVELRLSQARHWANAPREAVLVALRELEKGDYPAADQSRLLSGLAEVHYRHGHLQEACRLWQRLAEQPRHARDLHPRLRLLEAGLQLADDDLLRQTLAQIKTIEEGESAWWLYGEACRRILQVKQGQTQWLGEARTLLNRAVKMREVWPALLVAKAELEELDGHPEQAILQYRRAIDEGARQPRVIEELVRLLTSLRRHAEAEQERIRFQRLCSLTAR